METRALVPPKLETKILAGEESFRTTLGRLCDNSGAQLVGFEPNASAIVEGSFSVKVVIVSPKGETISRVYEFTRSRLLKLDKVFLLAHDHGNRYIKMSYNDDCQVSDVLETIHRHLKSTLRGMRSEAVAKKFFESLVREGGMVRSVRFATSKEDMEAIDLVVTVCLGGSISEVPIQIKTARIDQILHRRKHFGRGVPSIVFRSGSAKLKALRLKIFLLLEQYASQHKVLHV